MPCLSEAGAGLKESGGHMMHGRRNMGVEGAEAFTEVVLGLSVAAFCKAVFGTFSVTDAVPFTPEAFRRQGVPFVQSELHPMGGVENRSEGLFPDIAE
jgi:hypothetical protein